MLIDYVPSPLSLPKRSLTDLQSLFTTSVKEIGQLPGGLIALRKSVTLKAKAAIDEALLSMRWLAMPNPSAEDWKRIGDEVGAAHSMV